LGYAANNWLFYASGQFVNHTRKLDHHFPPIEAGLLATMSGGGMEGMLREWRIARPSEIELNSEDNCN